MPSRGDRLDRAGWRFSLILIYTFALLAIDLRKHGSSSRDEIDRHRSIRAYAPDVFTAAKLRAAVKVEADTGSKPSLILIEGIDLGEMNREDLLDVRVLADELAAEIWLSIAISTEHVEEIPQAVKRFDDAVSVVLALDPADDGTLALRALKDHDNKDLSALHVALDPSTLLLVRN